MSPSVAWRPAWHGAQRGMAPIVASSVTWRQAWRGAQRGSAPSVARRPAWHGSQRGMAPSITWRPEWYGAQRGVASRATCAPALRGVQRNMAPRVARCPASIISNGSHFLVLSSFAISCFLLSFTDRNYTTFLSNYFIFPWPFGLYQRRGLQEFLASLCLSAGCKILFCHSACVQCKLHVAHGLRFFSDIPSYPVYGRLQLAHPMDK